MSERDLRMALTDAGLAGDERVGVALAEHGVTGALHVWQRDPASRGVATRVTAALARMPAIAQRAQACGAAFIIPGDSDWPTMLDDLDAQAPVGLWCRGDATMLTRPAVAVVGARASTGYGERIAAQVAEHAAECDRVTVSGGAYGIDGTAHRGAIAAGGSTVVVLASGVDVAYPASNAALFQRVAQCGVLVSECAPGTQARKHLFLTRNRIIAALAQDTVVVEAALRSGALNTANWAAALGRRVWGVPGPVTSPASAGVNRGIADGSLSPLIDVAAISQAWPASPQQQPVGGLGHDILAALDAGAASLDEIARAVPGYPVAAIQGALTLLELAGHAGRGGRGWRLT